MSTTDPPATAGNGRDGDTGCRVATSGRATAGAAAAAAIVAVATAVIVATAVGPAAAASVPADDRSGGAADGPLRNAVDSSAAGAVPSVTGSGGGVLPQAGDPAPSDDENASDGVEENGTESAENGISEDDENASDGAEENGTESAENGIFADEEDGSADDEDDENGNLTRFRVVHTSPLLPRIDLEVENERIATNLTAGEGTGYVDLEADRNTYEFEMEANGSGDELLDRDVDLPPANVTLVLTAAIVNGSLSFRPVLLADDPDVPDEDRASLRLFHASPDAGPLTVTVSDPDGGGNGTLAGGITFPDEGPYIDVPAQELRVAVRPADNESAEPLATFEFTPDEETAHTLFLTGFRNPDAPVEEALELLVFRDAGAGADEPPTTVAATSLGGTVLGGVPPSETLTRVRVLHAAPRLPPVDAVVEDAPPVTIEAGVGGPYVAVEPGDSEYDVEALLAGSDTELFDVDVPLVTGGNHTLLLTGETGPDGAVGPQATFLADDHVVPDEETALVRFVHGSSATPRVSASLAGRNRTLTHGTSFRAADGYVPVEPGETTVVLRRADDGRELDRYEVDLDGGTVSTALLVGVEPDDRSLVTVPDVGPDAPVAPDATAEDGNESAG